MAKKADPLDTYKSKRNFSVTSEPDQGGIPNESARSFVVQKHWARRLHYDFRLELDGTMKSWAVPKGPSFDSADKRMAVHVEDHPISYNTFEGEIPPKQYGAGKVIIWDKGVWLPQGDARKGYQEGKLKFELRGYKLQGSWALVRIKGKKAEQDPWLLIKEKDEFSRPAIEFSVVDEMPDSVANLDQGGRAIPAEDTGTTSKIVPSKSKAAASKGKAAASKDKATASKSEAASAESEVAASEVKSANLHGKEAAHSAKKSSAGEATLPDTLKPQLATLVETLPTNTEQWLYEIKFDGYRLLTRMEKGRIHLYTRNGNDWTHRLDALARTLKSLGLPDGWYDGEIVTLDAQGLPDFQALQNAFDSSKTQSIVYYLFDLPFCNGIDLRAESLVERRQKLHELLAKTEAGSIRFSDTFDVPGHDIIAAACKLGLEGVIAKKKNSHYVSRRSGDWIKLKCSLRQEFVIGGYTDPQGSRVGIGSLLLGIHDDAGSLSYAGNVGTGFSEKTLAGIKQKLKVLQIEKSPFSNATGIDKKAHWVKPVMLAEVSFSQWTQSGHVRHPVFHGLRNDKPATDIIKETPMQTGANPVKANSLLAGLKVTHPERIVDGASKASKIDVIRHYAVVAPLMLEHLKSRPVSLVRAPDGVNGQVFFQKHMEAAAKMAGVRQLSRALDPGHAPLMEIASAQGLLNAAQLNVIEFHTWNAVKAAIARPDRMIFDLDPGQGVEWQAVQEAALAVHGFLEELGLVSFVKTSGGSGLHLVVPLKRRHDWDTVKNFSHAIVLHVTKTLPKRFSALSGPRNRIGKIFIDYLRNGFGATTVAAWSLRVRPGMGVSVPIGWDEVKSLHNSSQWHINNIHERLDVGNEPWRGYDEAARTLTAAMRVLEFKPQAHRG